MSYQKYQTNAIVLTTYPEGEANRVMVFYTRDFGLIRARAVGVREEKSKMRMALSQGAIAYVGLIRGKRGWRVAGAQSASCAFSQPEASRAFARLSLLLERLVVSEEKNERLFDSLYEARRALTETADRISLIELISVARMLHMLGYLSGESVSHALFINTFFDKQHFEEAAAQEKKLLQSVNRAISETQL